MLEYFDSHTHLQFKDYDNTREDILSEMKTDRMGLVNVGTTQETSKRAVKLSEKSTNEFIFSTVGIHPTKVSSNFQNDKEVNKRGDQGNIWNYDFFKNFTQRETVVAIGECGLDYFHLDSETKKKKEQQKSMFKKHIALAKDADLPLMIHCRPSENSMDAYNDLYDILKKENDLPKIIIHFFVGNKNMAKNFLDMGYFFTFGGAITFTGDYNDVVNYIPIDKILLETDAPYVTPEPHRGKRNKPIYVKEVYKKMADIKGVGLEELKSKIIENNEKVFGLDLS
ncbi:MAG: TatD family hydrolase [Candidatus Magasanikbacteria bacterium]